MGTAYATSSRLWFTLWNGIVTETYYPTLDRPQIRDLQYLVSDGKTFFHEEKRHLHTRMERPWANALAYRILNSDPDGRYQIEKQIITDPHLSCVLQHTKLHCDARFLSQLHLYAICAPHLGGRRVGQQRLRRRSRRAQRPRGGETRDLAGNGGESAL